MYFRTSSGGVGIGIGSFDLDAAGNLTAVDNIVAFRNNSMLFGAFETANATTHAYSYVYGMGIK